MVAAATTELPYAKHFRKLIFQLNLQKIGVAQEWFNLTFMNVLTGRFINFLVIVVGVKHLSILLNVID
jgi:hypothetical protein